MAAEAAIIAIENGYQVALLAPTEILAAQHYFSFKKLFGKLGYMPILLTGSNTRARKTQLKKLVAEGLANIAIGTHALLEADVEFRKLGLAMVDEQHRFGVMQRLKLYEKGATSRRPGDDGDADSAHAGVDGLRRPGHSIIDELPPGRKPIKTKHVWTTGSSRYTASCKKQVDRGQAYVVYPVIEESETQAMKAAQKMHQHLSEIVFPRLKVGLAAREAAPDEKEAVMAFKRGETQILVSTTVIEVGVDVPNATVMVIEQAERFGLAQFHQLRGRVGRGAEQSYCILVTGKLNDTARERIRTLVESTDGFYIAEMDMKLRGPGEFFGTKQSGLPSLRVANILRDAEILEIARAEAMAFVEHPPDRRDARDAVDYIQTHWQRRYGLVQVG